MIHTRCVLPLRGLAVRPYVRTLPFWSGTKHLAYTQPLTVAHKFLPSRFRHPVNGLRIPYGLAWMLALIGCVFGILALNLPGTASPVTSEVMASLRFIAFQLDASPNLSSSEEGALLPVDHLTSPSDTRGIPDDYGVDDNDSSAMLLSVHRFRAFSPMPVNVRLPRVARAFYWPTPYHVRPQLLSRL
jgi:hypothetical protein